MKVSPSNVVQTQQTTRQVGDTTIREQATSVTPTVDKNELGLAKFNQVIWIIAHLISVLVFFRFLFLLLDANLRGFSLAIYNIAAPFVRPFQGIFPAPTSGGSYFESAAVLAIAVMYLIAFLLTSLLPLFSNRVAESE